jgi:NAD(P)-dependent dehydrogenase (short-subunit alcohol dehydrogenase family)
MRNTVEDSEIINYQARPDLLAGRVVLVTGAGAGIGRAAALAYARHGAEVILLGRTVPKLEAVYDEIQALGGPRPSIVPMDLLKAEGEHYEALIDAITEQHGRLDGLLQNAAILGAMAPIEHYDVALWQRVLHVNLTAPFILTRCLLPLLRESEDASLIYTSSGVGRKGRAYWGAYSVSKFGIEALNQIVADEMERYPHVRINCVNPGGTRTELRRQAFPAEDRDKLPTPEDILGPYLYLMGPDSRGVTGRSVDCQPRH